MAQMKMSKRQQAKFQAMLEGMGTILGKEATEIQEEVNTLYDDETSYYEGQAVLNFYKARIEPRLGKDEFPSDFDKRYREWRIKTCETCEEEFAYAFHYDGVKFCSLECLDSALHKIGLKVTRGRDLKKRWGIFFHPAVVPSTALGYLKELYPIYVGDDVSQIEKDHQQSPVEPESQDHE